MKIGALVLGPLLLNMSLIESAIMGTILAAVSPAVVVPKMLKLMNEGIGTKKLIPQMIIAGASADDIFVIVLFTSLVSMAKEGNFSILTFVKFPVSIILGIGVGILLGLAMVWFFKKFHLRDTSKVLIIICFVLFLVTVERLDHFPFSGLLATVALGITILAKYPLLAGRLVSKYEKIWIFAEMLLFVLVGAAVDITTIPSIGLWAVLLVLGMFVFRSLGVYLATLGKTLTFKEQLFSVFSYLPKATVQASISSIPLALGISNGGTMLTVAVLAILITAPLGALLIDLTARPLLGKPTLNPEVQ